MLHILKTWPEFHRAIREKRKTFEVRVDDRNFQEGDTLRLAEFDPVTETLTPRPHEVRIVAYILRGEPAERFGLKPGYCVLGLGEENRAEVSTLPDDWKRRADNMRRLSGDSPLQNATMTGLEIAARELRAALER